jgi:hypothetical protein
VALLTSLSGAVLGLFNLGVYWHDREGRVRKETFDNQITVAKFYFENIGAAQDKEFCDRRQQALMFSRVSLAIAGLSESDVPVPQHPGSSFAERRNGVEQLALLVAQDLSQRLKDLCDGPFIVLASKPAAGTVVDAAPAAGELSYARKPSVPAPAAGVYRVFIQFPAGGRDRAEALRRAIDGDAQFRAPGVEQVRQAPKQDQIRIYKSVDQDRAKELQARFEGLAGAQIVNLESAFPRLPPGTIEIWLAP